MRKSSLDSVPSLPGMRRDKMKRDERDKQAGKHHPEGTLRAIQPTSSKNREPKKEYYSARK
jgi:hypothetical protein